IFRTPEPMKSYSILLLNSALIDIVSAAGNGLSVARLIRAPDGALLTLYVGPCSLVGERFCHMAYCVHVFFVIHATLILLQSFYFRMYILPANPSLQVIPTRTTTWVISTALFAPTIFMM
ncbi:hypothetical protein PFISCL1PPCAC_17832, partial [Pristionchus fissidentatus]